MEGQGKAVKNQGKAAKDQRKAVEGRQQWLTCSLSDSRVYANARENIRKETGRS